MREKNLQKLGEKLQNYRVSAKKELVNVSDAIELDSTLLKEIEAGKVTPEEETLALLISHLKISEKQATELWDLAGYDTINVSDIFMAEETNNNKREIRINMSADLQVLYSDMVQVSSNKYGVTVQFIQSGPNDTANVVSRIGMSKEHAESFIDTLKKNIENKN